MVAMGSELRFIRYLLPILLLCLVFGECVTPTSFTNDDDGQFDTLRVDQSNETSFMLRVKLWALNRTFSIVPSKVTDRKPVFDSASKVVVHRDGKPPVTVFADHFDRYSLDGHLDDDPSAVVRTKLVGAVIDGVIKSNGTVFYIERSIGSNWSTFPPTPNVYRASDVQLFCPECPNSVLDIPISKYGLVAKMSAEGYRDYIWKQLIAAHSTSNSDNRKRRMCGVKILADHSFYERVGGSDVAWTVSEIELHVRETNDILVNTDFDGDGHSDGYRLVVSEIEIRTDREYESDRPVNSSTFLDYVSRRRLFDGGHCLGIGLTARKFADGVTGASHMASPSFLLPGGLCTPPIDLKRILVNKTGMHLAKESVHLNTGVMTFSGRLQGSLRIPRSVSVVHFANLVSHLMGSGHESHWHLSGCVSSRNTTGSVFSEADSVHPLMVIDAMTTQRRYSPCAVSKMHLVLRAKGICLK